MGPVRIVCLDCPRGSQGLIDLCPTLRCTDAQIPLSKRRDLMRSHLPSHCLLRVPYVLHCGMEANTLDRAREGQKRAAEKLLDAEPKKKPTEDSETRSRKALPTSSTGEGDVKKRICLVCREIVAAPCWFCVECEGDVLFRSVSAVPLRIQSLKSPGQMTPSCVNDAALRRSTTTLTFL
jgi:hypothetical protein